MNFTHEQISELLLELANSDNGTQLLKLDWYFLKLLFPVEVFPENDTRKQRTN